jgi:biopolymer transport protein TolR
VGGKIGNTKGGPMADINVTPLVDVVLVLLIIFMVVTPLLSSGIDVSLPKARTTEATQDVGQHIVVGIRNDGAVFIDTTQTTLEDLIPDINEAFRDNPARSILVKADSHLPYRTVREVMDAIAEGGMTTLLLAAEKYEDKAGE